MATDTPAPKENPRCPNCNGSTFRHTHNCAHGIAETHMAGTERFECVQCGRSIRAAEGKPLGFNFILD
jgi:uncharacterized protein with PIN domain